MRKFSETPTAARRNLQYSPKRVARFAVRTSRTKKWSSIPRGCPKSETSSPIRLIGRPTDGINANESVFVVRVGPQTLVDGQRSVLFARERWNLYNTPSVVVGGRFSSGSYIRYERFGRARRTVSVFRFYSERISGQTTRPAVLNVVATPAGRLRKRPWLGSPCSRTHSGVLSDGRIRSGHPRRTETTVSIIIIGPASSSSSSSCAYYYPVAGVRSVRTTVPSRCKSAARLCYW